MNFTSRRLVNALCICVATAALAPMPGQASQENYLGVVLDVYEPGPPTVNQLNPIYGPLVANATFGLNGRGLANAQAAIVGVSGLMDSLVNNPIKDEGLLLTLASMTPAQQAQFFNQVQPTMIGSVQAFTSSLFNLGSGFSASIDSRLQAARQTDGLSAGDAVGRGFTVWAVPLGDIANQRMNDGVSGYTASTYGLATGGDTLIRPDLRVGAAVAVSNTDIAFSDQLSGNKSRVLTAQAGIYGAWYVDRFFLDGAASFGYSWYNSTESISAFGLTRTSGFTGTQFSGNVAAGYDIQTHGIQITPLVGLQEIHLNIAPYTTTGGGMFDLSVSGQSIDVTQVKIGSRFAYPMSQGNGWQFTPDLHGYYVRNLNTSPISTSASFQSGGSFTTTAPARDPDMAELGVGFTVAQSGPFMLTALYDYAFGRTTSDNKFFLRVKGEF